MGAAQSAKVEASILSKVQKLKTNREGWQSVIEEFLTLVPATGAPLRCRDRRVLEVVLQLCAEELRDPQPTVTPLLEDALMDRDLVHRQTSATVVKHLTLGVFGLGCEDALQHLLNFVWPNVFEQSPHVITAVLECIEAMRVSLGPTKVLQHTLQGLWHPARKVREVYWKIYNNLYIGSQAALVPAYPRMTDDVLNQYTRTHMELFL